MWDQFVKWVTFYGMPVVTAYHLVISNIFINTTAQNATGLEKAGNLVLTPVQYLFCGKIATYEEGKYHLKQRFDYQSHIILKMTLSAVATPISLPVGTLLKGMAFLTEETRQRHAAIALAADSRDVHSNLQLYHRLGIPLSSTYEPVTPPQYHRRPGEENKFALEKQLLKEIVRIFNEEQIPYWVDTGTCLGAYRYGGVIPWDKDVDLVCLFFFFVAVVVLLCVVFVG